MSNLWLQFRNLLPSQTLLVGTVQSLNADGTSTVVLPDGRLIRAQGQEVAQGDAAFVRAGETGARIEGQAPSLGVFTEEV